MRPDGEPLTARAPSDNESASARTEFGQHGAIRYRADVDGLRAVAIIPVVAFHAGFGGLPGGFTGVDVFFVISGYLIGAQIFRQSAAGSFRYLPFYARRLRRIIPALLALLLLFFAAGWLLLTPTELRELGKESVAAVFGGSNFLFYLGGDYFAPAADLNPLLHTWSLGVEEQFYIVLPILAAVLIRKFKAPATVSLLVITVSALAASIVLTHVNPQAAFYLLPTRFWELSLGALIATSGVARSSSSRGPAGQVVGLAGALMIFIGIVAYRPEFAFPGTWVLLPTLGAASVIAAGGSWVNRLVLANPVTVFIGKVSYSWYLWHWPLFYMARVIGIEERVHPGILALLSLALGALSWRFVEQPFRRRRGNSERSVVLRYAAAIVSVALLALLVYEKDGFPGRLSGAARISAEDAQHTQDDPCLLRVGDVSVAPAGCQFSSISGPAVAVVGDSHGASIAPGFERAASGQGYGLRQLTKSLCTGQWGYANVVSDRPDSADECLDYQARTFKAIADDPRIRIVVLASRWSHEQELVSAPGSRVVGLEEALDSTMTRLERLGRKVVVVQDAPSFVFDPYSTVIGEALPLRAFLRRVLGVPLADGVAPFSQIEADDSREILIRLAARHPDAALFDPWRKLCDPDGCRFNEGGDLYYFDNQHLTIVGAVQAVGVGPKLPAG